MRIAEAESFDELTSRARRFGSRRKINYQVSSLVLFTFRYTQHANTVYARMATAPVYYIGIGSLVAGILTEPLERVTDFWNRITSWV